MKYFNIYIDKLRSFKTSSRKLIYFSILKKIASESVQMLRGKINHKDTCSLIQNKTQDRFFRY